MKITRQGENLALEDNNVKNDPGVSSRRITAPLVVSTYAVTQVGIPTSAREHDNEDMTRTGFNGSNNGLIISVPLVNGLGHIGEFYLLAYDRMQKPDIPVIIYKDQEPT